MGPRNLRRFLRRLVFAFLLTTWSACSGTAPPGYQEAIPDRLVQWLQANGIAFRQSDRLLADDIRPPAAERRASSVLTVQADPAGMAVGLLTDEALLSEAPENLRIRNRRVWMAWWEGGGPVPAIQRAVFLDAVTGEFLLSIDGVGPSQP